MRTPFRLTLAAVFVFVGLSSPLLAEDDSAISEPLARALRREGYEVDHFPRPFMDDKLVILSPDG